ncbi:MAG: hypothetical protein KatS3mg115_0032 [Candidatus Poribacteria bacterium]|nr:MAG: hypothetical protein KatS3mg115_0032 [Candidatus Poribacteria bacterium]
MVAYYGTAYGWITALAILPGAVLSALFPRLADYSRPGGTPEDRERLRRLVERSFRAMATLGLGAATLLYWVGPELIRLLYQLDAYPPGTIDAAFQSLSGLGGLLFLTMVVSNVLRAANRGRAVLLLMLGATGVHLLAGALLMGRYHHRGAGWAAGLSELFLVLVGTGYIHWKLAPVPGVGVWTRLLLLGLLSNGFFSLVRSWPIWGSLPTGAVLYAGLALMLRLIRWGDFLPTNGALRIGSPPSWES